MHEFWRCLFLVCRRRVAINKGPAFVTANGISWSCAWRCWCTLRPRHTSPTLPTIRATSRSQFDGTDFSMRSLSKGFRAVSMVFTANESIVASTQLSRFSRRTEHSLANKPNGADQRTFEVSYLSVQCFWARLMRILEWNIVVHLLRMPLQRWIVWKAMRPRCRNLYRAHRTTAPVRILRKLSATWAKLVFRWMTWIGCLWFMLPAQRERYDAYWYCATESGKTKR